MLMSMLLSPKNPRGASVRTYFVAISGIRLPFLKFCSHFHRSAINFDCFYMAVLCLGVAMYPHIVFLFADE